MLIFNAKWGGFLRQSELSNHLLDNLKFFLCSIFDVISASLNCIHVYSLALVFVYTCRTFRNIYIKLYEKEDVMDGDIMHSRLFSVRRRVLRRCDCIKQCIQPCTLK